MAKKLKKEMEEKDMIITSEQMRKMERASRRQIEIERGSKRIRTGAHKTSKKDIDDEYSNTLSPEEIEEIKAEETTEVWSDLSSLIIQAEDYE